MAVHFLKLLNADKAGYEPPPLHVKVPLACRFRASNPKASRKHSKHSLPGETPCTPKHSYILTRLNKTP